MPYYTIINTKGNVLFSKEFDNISTYNLDEEDKTIFLKIKNNGKVGVIDSNGIFIIEPKYDHISSLYTFSELKYFIVELNDKIGVIDEKGNEIIEIKYEKQYSTPLFNDGLILLKRNGKKYYFNEKGEIKLEVNATDANSFYNGLALIKRNGLYGYINKKGDTQIECKYNEGYSLNDNEDFALVNFRGKWGIIDKIENIICDFNFDKINHKEDDGIFEVKIGKLTGYICPFENKKTAELLFKDIKYINRNIIIAKKDKLWGVVDCFDNQMLPFEFDEIKYDYKLNNLCGRKKKKWEIYNSSNPVELKYTCESYESFDNSIVIKNKKETILINEKKSIQIDIDEPIRGFKKYLVFKKDGLQGVLDQSGKIVISNKYELIEYHDYYSEISTEKSYFIVKIEDKYGVIDEKENFICDLVFDNIKIREGIAFTSNNNQNGYFDLVDGSNSDTIFKNVAIIKSTNERIIILTEENVNSIDTSYFVDRENNKTNEFTILLLKKEYENSLYIVAIGRIGGGLYGDIKSKIENVKDWIVTKGYFSTNYDSERWEYNFNGDISEKCDFEINSKDQKIFDLLIDELNSKYMFYDEINDLPLLKEDLIAKIGKSRYKSTTETWMFKNLSKHWGLFYGW